MNVYSEVAINELFVDDKFIDDYHEYSKDNQEIDKLKNFIDSIELNRKYFRLEMNKKKGSRNKNANISEDTIALKEINSLLNKTTDKNILLIREKIKVKVSGKGYLTEMIIESILDKCIIHTPYIPLYLDLINHLYSNNKVVNDTISKLTEKIYYNIVNHKITGSSEYLLMCDKNKKLDNLIGHSILVTELEKKKITRGKIHDVITNLITTLSNCSGPDEVDEKYKCVQCLYNMLKSYYGGRRLPECYMNRLRELIEVEDSNKIKFRMMDICERK
jgi:hypothetical protein|tara:strand:- start:824 stop:1648 length:825 start_codon:yes stop_codon:yes gene_type:complete